MERKKILNNWGFLALIAVSFAASSCATSTKQSQSTQDSHNSKTGALSESDQVRLLQEQVQQLSASMARTNDRLDSIDTRITLVNDQVQAKAEETPAKSPPLKAKSVKTVSHPATGVGSKAKVPPAPNDPDAGLQSGEAVQRFRSAMALYDGKKYSQAVLEFSNFVRDFADHALAAAAQFYTGEAYRAQNELKLATEEYKRILISYDHSSYLQDALKRLVECFETLKLTDEAKTHRATLVDLFPDSKQETQEVQRDPGSFPTADPMPEAGSSQGHH